MGVLVGVNVGEAQAAVLQGRDLRGGLGFNLIGWDAAGEKLRQEFAQCGMECAGAWRGEPGDFTCWEHGGAIDQNDVAADAQGRGSQRLLDGRAGSGRGCHERGAGEASVGMRFGDGAVDAVGEAEVVRVDDEPPHGSVYQFEQ